MRPRAWWAALLALVLLLPAPASLAASTGADGSGADMTVVDVTVTPTADDLADGFASLRVELALRSSQGLPDELLGPNIGLEDTVSARPVPGTGPVLLPGEQPARAVVWTALRRVQGTATDGVWRADVLVSPALSGRWQVTHVRDFGGSPYDLVDVTAFGAGFELGPQGGSVVAVAPVPTPVRVVSGTETWTPRARTTERRTGVGVRAGWTTVEVDQWPLPRLAPGSVPRADAQGHVSLPTVPVVRPDGDTTRYGLRAYASRGSRGYSWESSTVLWPQVKWQARQQYAVSGRTVTATGNAWPAPDVYPAANPAVHLQQLVGRTWRTVATSRVRDNGRYTLTWAAPTAGPQVLRVYKPGGLELGRTSVGTTMAAVGVTTR